MPEPQRIVAVLPTAVGDCVQTTPALRALRELYPAARITAMCHPNCAGVIADLPWYDEALWFGPGAPDGHPKGFWSLLWALRARSFDLAVVFKRAFWTALAVRLAGIPRRVGWRARGRSLLFTDLPAPSRYPEKIGGNPAGWMSNVEHHLGLVTYLGAKDSDPRPRLFVNEVETLAAHVMLRRNGLDPERPYVVLNPGAKGSAAKCWSPQGFAAVADELLRRGRQVVVMCGPGEQATAGAIFDAQTAKPQAANLKDEKPDLAAYKAIVGGAALLITNDSGLRHVAIALGRPVVALFGSTEPKRTECFHETEMKVVAVVECGPCKLKVCPIDHRCMKMITPAIVLQAADDLEHRIAAGAAPIRPARGPVTWVRPEGVTLEPPQPRVVRPWPS